MASTKRDMALAGGSVATTERFHRLAWSPSGAETGELPVRVPATGARRSVSRAAALTRQPAARPPCAPRSWA